MFNNGITSNILGSDKAVNQTSHATPTSNEKVPIRGQWLAFDASRPKLYTVVQSKLPHLKRDFESA